MAIYELIHRQSRVIIIHNIYLSAIHILLDVLQLEIISSLVAPSTLTALSTFNSA
jgi:hypothetical protein